MKGTNALFLATAALSGVSAAAPPSPPAIEPVYVTHTISECESDLPEVTVTVTARRTVTYCPECDALPSWPPFAGITIYETVYNMIYTDGPVWSVKPRTYTVTESCGEGRLERKLGDDHVPDGFTVASAWCTHCATPSAVTITEPCGCEATNGVPIATGMPSPPGAGSNNELGQGGGVGGAGDWNSDQSQGQGQSQGQAPAAPAASVGSAAYAAQTGVPPAVSGPPGMPSVAIKGGGSISSNNAGNNNNATTTVTPYEGASSSLHSGIVGTGLLSSTMLSCLVVAGLFVGMI